MKKLLLLLFIAIVSFSFVSCRNGGSELDINLDEFIENPSNLTIDNKTLSWDAVENADGYIVYVNGEEVDKVNTNSYDFSGLTGDSLIFQVITEAPRGMQDSGLSASVAYVANPTQEIADISSTLNQTSFMVPDGFSEELVRKGMTNEVLEGYIDAFEVYSLSLNTSETITAHYNALNDFLSEFENIEAIISAFVVTMLPENIQNEIDRLNSELIWAQAELNDEDNSMYREYYQQRVDELEMSIDAFEALLEELEVNSDRIVLSIKTTMEYLMSIEEMLSSDLIGYIQNLSDDAEGSNPEFNLDEIVLIKDEIVNVLRETMPSQEDMVLIYELYEVVSLVAESTVTADVTFVTSTGKTAARTLLTLEASINFLDGLDRAYFEVLVTTIDEGESIDLYMAEKAILTIKYYDSFRDDNEALLESIREVYSEEEKELMFDSLILGLQNESLNDLGYDTDILTLESSLSAIDFQLLLYLEITFRDVFDAVLDVFVSREGELLNTFIILDGFYYYSYYDEYTNNVTGEIYDSFGDYNHFKALSIYDFVKELSFALEAGINTVNDEDYSTFIEVLLSLLSVDLLTEEFGVEDSNAAGIISAINLMMSESSGDQLELIRNLIEYVVNEDCIDELYQIEEDVYAYINSEYSNLDYLYIVEHDSYVKYASWIQMADYYVDFMNNANRGLLDNIIEEVVVLLEDEDFQGYTELTAENINNFETNIDDLFDYIKTALEQIANFDASDLSETEEAAIELFITEVSMRLVTIMVPNSDN